MDENNLKIKYIDLQLIAIIGFVLALIISLLINYDKKCMLSNNKRLFTNEEAEMLAKMQSTLVLIITLIFLYTNYNQYKIAKYFCDKDVNNALLSINISTLAVIGALIGIYIVFKSDTNELSIAQSEVL